MSVILKKLTDIYPSGGLARVSDELLKLETWLLTFPTQDYFRITQRLGRISKFLPNGRTVVVARGMWDALLVDTLDLCSLLIQDFFPVASFPLFVSTYLFICCSYVVSLLLPLSHFSAV